jgi:hypothetical protein
LVLMVGKTPMIVGVFILFDFNGVYGKIAV